MRWGWGRQQGGPDARASGLGPSTHRPNPPGIAALAPLLGLCNPRTWQPGEQRSRGGQGKEERREAGPEKGMAMGSTASGWAPCLSEGFLEG